MVKSTDFEGVVRHSELQIATFWQRMAADLIDLLLLLVFFFLLGLLFPDYFFSIGPGGRIFSFGISVAYFGLLGSRHGRGQTLGKRLLKITVVNAQGQYLLKRRSFIRAGLLFTLLSINGWAMPPLSTTTVGLLAQGTLTIGGLLALAYSYLFNLETRQGPHDLITDTYVARIPPKNGLPAPYRPRVHERIVAILFALGAAVTSLGYIVINEGFLDSRLQGILNLQHQLSTDERFFSVSISYVPESEQLNVRGWYKENCSPEICEALIQDLVFEILTRHPSIDEIDTLEVTIFNRIDVNLILRIDVENYNLRLLRTHSAAPADWRITLAENKLAAGNSLLEQNAYDLAVEAYTQAVTVSPTFASAYYNRGLVYEIQGQYQLAIEDLTRAAALDERLVNAYGVRGRIFYIIGSYPQALDDLRLYKRVVGDNIPPDLQAILDELERILK
ncbi:MAG: RDD family protein [Anaerolineae bacterium]|nr:RDD family protein [Anaerolineae bacterium]